MLNCINFNFGLNIYGTVVCSDRDKIVAFLDKMISEFLAYFHCACAQTAIWELLGPDLQRIVSATYELLNDKWNLRQTHDNGRGIFRKSYAITEKQTKVFDAKLPYWFSLSAI